MDPEKDHCDCPQREEGQHAKMRKAILEIQANPTLSASEKASMIQALMCPQKTKPVFTAPQVVNSEPTPEELSPTLHATGNPGCAHYITKCKLRAACCGRFFTCRFCHDEAVHDHQFVRYDTREMMCMCCQKVQPVAQTCSGCGQEMARYFCDVCKLFDGDHSRPIYHCPHCKLCRVGKGLDIDFFHCMRCNACLPVSMRNHRCVENSLEADCPVCHQFMFTSREKVIFMSCNHTIHKRCYKELMRTSLVCPICNKSLHDPSNLTHWLDTLVSQQPMPPEYASSIAHILCNDCQSKQDVPLHFLGHKCTHCNSYNTRTLSTKNLPGNSSTDTDLSSNTDSSSNDL